MYNSKVGELANRRKYFYKYKNLNGGLLERLAVYNLVVCRLLSANRQYNG
jgi:hypothetical protein